ncbi:MAG: hypothetical protein AB1611_03275 [bacterium]
MKNKDWQQEKQEIVRDIARLTDAAEEIIRLRNARIRDLARFLHSDITVGPVKVDDGVNPLAMRN